MWKIIEKILNKSEKERRHILFVSTTILTAFIIFVWLSFLYARYLNENNRRSVQYTASPFEIFAKEMQDRFKQVKEDYKDITDTISEVSNIIENIATSSSFTATADKETDNLFSHSTTSEKSSSTSKGRVNP